MKVLSVRQPWAWALIHGGKDVENRSWPTDYRGPLAIHAGKTFDMTRAEFQDMYLGEYGQPFEAMAEGYYEIAKAEGHPKGAIIGIVDLVDCIPDSACHSEWKAEGEDFWCWIVENPRALAAPIPRPGQLRLFNVPDSLFTDAELRGAQ